MAEVKDLKILSIDELESWLLDTFKAEEILDKSFDIKDDFTRGRLAGSYDLAQELLSYIRRD